jgi:DNA repair ATPase RecN
LELTDSSAHLTDRIETKPESVEAVTEANTELNRVVESEEQSTSRQRRPSQKLLDSYATGGNRYQKSFATAYRISMNKALKSDRLEESKEAAADEIKNMLQYKVGHYVSIEDIPFGMRRNILSSFMFLKNKEDAQGMYTRTKARLVGNGANQKEHMYDLVSSATVGLVSVFLLLNVASFFRTMLCSFDIKGAFLNARFGISDVVTYIRLNRAVTRR